MSQYMHDTTITEYLRYYLRDRPFLGQRVPPWVSRERARNAARLAALEEARLFTGQPADDCEPAAGNCYRHYRPHRDDLYNLRRMLAETDCNLFDGLFATHGILPEIDWWWRTRFADGKTWSALARCPQRKEKPRSSAGFPLVRDSTETSERCGSGGYGFVYL